MGALALLKRSLSESKSLELTTTSTKTALEKRAETLPSPRELTPEQIQKRDEKWLFCSMVLAHQKKTGKNRVDSCLHVAINCASYFPILLKAGKGGKSALTSDNCRNWLRLMGKKGKEWDLGNRDVLVDNYSNGLRKRPGAPEFWKSFLPLYLNPNQLSKTECRRLAMRKCRESNPLAEIPTLDQVNYQVRRLDKVAVALARHGEEYVKNNMLAYADRDWREVLVNDVWFADHRVFDMYIKVKDPETGKWKAVRPWLCGFLDGKSWYMVSWQITVNSPNNETIRNGLALGISQYGRPANFYIDNGKDFKKKGFVTPVELDKHEHSIINNLGIRRIHSIPYRGRSKTIERSFKDHAETFCKLFASYLGNCPGARPERSKHYQDHPEELLTLEQFSLRFQAWLEDHHHRINKGKILNGQTPHEAFFNGKRLERAPMSKDEFYAAFLLPLPRLYKVRRGPAVYVDKQRYYGECLFKHYGEELMVKTDWMRPEHVFVFHPDGKPIGECKTRKALKAIATTPEDYKAISKEMKFQGGQLKRCYTVLDDITDGLHLLSPDELLRLPENFDIVKLNSTNSVKGSTHKLTTYKAIDLDKKEIETDNNNFDFREDRKELESENFRQKAVLGDIENEVTTDAETLNEFFKVAVQAKGDNEDDY